MNSLPQPPLGGNSVARLPIAEAQLHIEIITGFPDAVMHFRLIHPAKDRQAIKLKGTVAGLWAQFQEHQKLGYGVFVVVNEGGDADEEIIRVRALFADGDDIPIPEIWHVPPTFLVIRDETHWHALGA
jgi:hypothetical protein